MRETEDSIDAFMQTHRALGASYGQALAMVVTVFGEHVAVHQWRSFLARGPQWDQVLTVLDQIAVASRDCANSWLRLTIADTEGQRSDRPPWNGTPCFPFSDIHWLVALSDPWDVGGWIDLENCTALVILPRQFRVGGTLSLLGCPSLEDLSPGLSVGGDLLLDGCHALVKLQEGLSVGGDLKLRECPSWDGVIPDDARVDGAVFTDEHWQGVPLPEWRQFHPKGEHA